MRAGLVETGSCRRPRLVFDRIMRKPARGSGCEFVIRAAQCGWTAGMSELIWLPVAWAGSPSMDGVAN